MKMPDGNTSALSIHEAEQDKRQRSYDSLLPKAEAYLREWVRDGETIGRPDRFRKLSCFVLADRIYDDPMRYGVDTDFLANLIAPINKEWVENAAKRIGDNAYDAWLLTPEASNALDDIVEWLEECREDAD